jgi:hypothetical protein
VSRLLTVLALLSPGLAVALLSAALILLTLEP